MYKFAIAALFTTFLLCGCNEEPDIPEDDLTIGLQGWEISKSTYDFDINPRDMYFVDENIGVVRRHRDTVREVELGQHGRALTRGDVVLDQSPVRQAL